MIRETLDEGLGDKWADNLNLQVLQSNDHGKLPTISRIDLEKVVNHLKNYHKIRSFTGESYDLELLNVFYSSGLEDSFHLKWKDINDQLLYLLYHLSVDEIRSLPTLTKKSAEEYKDNRDHFPWDRIIGGALLIYIGAMLMLHFTFPVLLGLGIGLFSLGIGSISLKLNRYYKMLKELDVTINGKRYRRSIFPFVDLLGGGLGDIVFYAGGHGFYMMWDFKNISPLNEATIDPAREVVCKVCHGSGIFTWEEEVLEKHHGTDWESGQPIVEERWVKVKHSEICSNCDGTGKVNLLSAVSCLNDLINRYNYNVTWIRENYPRLIQLVKDMNEKAKIWNCKLGFC